jgi:hypothetical protein
MVSNSFYKPLRVAALLLSLTWLHAQSSGHLSVGEIPKVTGKRSAAVEAKIPMAVDPGFHVNSNKPNEDFLIPLKLTWVAPGALEAGEINYPKANQEKYDFSEKPVSVFSGKFEVTANFKVAPNAPAGPGIAAGKLRYQACSSKACYPPKTVDVNVPYSVQ